MPLTTTGIAVQILSSIGTYKQKGALCTTNDCKVVVNHLVRKFTEPLDRACKQARLQSTAVRHGATDDTIDDHAVPVIVLVERLLELPEEDLVIDDKSIEKLCRFLTSCLLLVEVTREEDARLSQQGFQRKMPESWYQSGHLESGDPLARYRAAGIEIEA